MQITHSVVMSRLSKTGADGEGCVGDTGARGTGAYKSKTMEIIITKSSTKHKKESTLRKHRDYRKNKTVSSGPVMISFWREISAFSQNFK